MAGLFGGHAYVPFRKREAEQFPNEGVGSPTLSIRTKAICSIPK